MEKIISPAQTPLKPTSIPRVYQGLRSMLQVEFCNIGRMPVLLNLAQMALDFLSAPGMTTHKCLYPLLVLTLLLLLQLTPNRHSPVAVCKLTTFSMVSTRRPSRHRSPSDLGSTHPLCLISASPQKSCKKEKGEWKGKEDSRR